MLREPRGEREVNDANRQESRDKALRYEESPSLAIDRSSDGAWQTCGG